MPRSLSEFNLSGAAGDLYELAAFGPRRGTPGPAPASAGATAGKARDKMVTFEDEGPGGAGAGKLPADDVDVFM